MNHCFLVLHIPFPVLYYVMALTLVYTLVQSYAGVRHSISLLNYHHRVLCHWPIFLSADTTSVHSISFPTARYVVAPLLLVQPRLQLRLFSRMIVASNSVSDIFNHKTLYPFSS